MARDGRTTPLPPGRWLSTREVARLTGMSDWWVREQIAAGRLAARVYGAGARKTIRIMEADLSAFLASMDRRD
jgi:excisionase family DNA binding protein